MTHAEPPSPWLSIEALLRHAFSRCTVVMLNEAHNGMVRCPRTRRVGRELLSVAHALGCRHLAMEALPNPGPGPVVLDGPPEAVGYLQQPEMRQLVDEALRLGFELVAYESVHGARPTSVTDGTSEAANWRWQQQAEHLAAAARRLGDSRLLVWAGNGNHKKKGSPQFTPMGERYARLDAPEAFAIDQIGSVAMHDGHVPMVVVDEPLRRRLDAHGGTLGFVAGAVPSEIRRTVPGYDAFVVSTDNEMVG